MAEQWWKKRHEQCERLTETHQADVAFLGDSITENWEKHGKPVWEREIAPFKAVNFGFGGDGTDHVLWRLNNGELVGMNPKVVVVMIGSCNVKRGVTPEDTAEGVTAVVDKLRTDLPNSKILLLGILPRGRTAEDEIWQAVARTDEILEQYDGGDQVRFLDIGDSFVKDDGTSSEELLPDGVHLSEEGYEVWAQAIKPTLQEMLAQ